MNIRHLFTILLLYTTTVAATDPYNKEYYDPGDEDDKVILWKPVFIKLNTLLVETDKITQKLLTLDRKFDDLNNRQEDQERQLTKLVEIANRIEEQHLEFNTRQEDQGKQMAKLMEFVHSNSKQISTFAETADFNTKYLKEIRLESKERQEDQANQILKLQETADFNTKYMREVRLDSKERLEALEGKISKIMETAELTTKSLAEMRLESNKRQEDEGIQMVKLEENFNATSKVFDERQEEQGKQILKLQETADFNTKYMREVRLDSKERLEALEGKISKIMETAELTTKSLAEMRLESNKRQEAEGIQIVKLEENFNATSKVFDERQEEQDKQKSKALEAVDLTVKFVNETRSEFNKRQDALEDQLQELTPWTTILRRQDGSVDFYRNWTEYQMGFGNPPYGEFFIGLDRLHEMTTNGPHELMVVLRDWENEERFAHYDLFEIGGEDDQYALNKLGTYSGNAGDSLEYHKGMKFSTMNNDNDEWESRNCAERYNGAWWFKYCSQSLLTGRYRKENEANQWGVVWNDWKKTFDYSFQYAEMKIRPKAR